MDEQIFHRMVSRAAKRLWVRRRRQWRQGRLTNDYPADRELTVCALVLALHYPKEFQAEAGGNLAKAIYGAIAIGDFLIMEEAFARTPQSFARWLRRWQQRAGVDDEFITECRNSFGNYVHVRGRLAPNWGLLFSFGKIEAHHAN